MNFLQWTRCLCLFRVELLAESNAQLLAKTLEGLEILLVLVLVLNLGLDTCSQCEYVPNYGTMLKRLGRLLRTFEDPDSGGEVVDAAGGLEGSGENLNRGYEIVSEAVVQVALVGDK